MQDRAATERALSYNLQNHKPFCPSGTAMLAIPHSVNSEAALAQASDLLRCANEAGNGLSDPSRDLLLSAMNLVERTRDMSTSFWYAGNALKQYAPDWRQVRYICIRHDYWIIRLACFFYAWLQGLFSRPI